MYTCMGYVLCEVYWGWQQVQREAKDKIKLLDVLSRILIENLYICSIYNILNWLNKQLMICQRDKLYYVQGWPEVFNIPNDYVTHCITPYNSYLEGWAGGYPWPGQSCWGRTPRSCSCWEPPASPEGWTGSGLKE